MNYETGLRDKKHSRIYRIVYNGEGVRGQGSGVSKYTLAEATPEKLVATLKNDNLFWRRHAQRLLVERGKQDVAPALVEMARDPSVDAIGLNVGVIHALWTLHGLGALDGSHAEATAVAVAALRHPAAGVRRNAVQVLPHDAKSVAAILSAGLTRDSDAQVRLMSLLALADQPPTPAAAEAIVAVLSDPANARDRWIPDAAASAAANNSEAFLERAIRQEATLDPSRSVEANFRAYTVTTSAGRVLTGLLASESKTTIELFDAEGKKQTILRQDIEELVATNKSLMPDGFEKLLRRKELNDLLEFLTARGKYLPLPLDKVATIVSTKGMFNGEESLSERLVFGDWKPKTFEGVPFHLVDPQGDRAANAIMLYSPRGRQPPKMPKSVSLTCNVPAKAIHLLSGISGWGHPDSAKDTVSMIVRLHYADGRTEDHVLKNGEQFADCGRRIDVPGSKFAFDLNGRQVRYLAIEPKRKGKIERIEFVKGPDDTAPIVMAVTVEPLE